MSVAPNSFPANICWSPRRFENFFKTCLLRLSSRSLKRNNFSSSKTSSRCLQDVFKMSSRRLQDVFENEESFDLKNLFPVKAKEIIIMI